MEILGHWDPRMTVRYQHLAPAFLHNAMQALKRHRQGTEEAIGGENVVSPTGTERLCTFTFQGFIRAAQMVQPRSGNQISTQHLILT